MAIASDTSGALAEKAAPRAWRSGLVARTSVLVSLVLLGVFAAIAILGPFFAGDYLAISPSMTRMIARSP